MFLSAGSRKQSCASGGEWMTLKWILFVTQIAPTARTSSCVSTEYHVLLLQLLFNLMQPLDFEFFSWLLSMADSPGILNYFYLFTLLLYSIAALKYPV